jgi:hypothetical protein
MPTIGRRAFVFVATLVAATSACRSPVSFVTPTPDPRAVVVVVSGGGPSPSPSPVTRTPTVTPRSVYDMLTAIAPSTTPTRDPSMTAVPTSPSPSASPSITPLSTRTVAPTATMEPTLEVPPTPTRTPLPVPPSRTPGPPTVTPSASVTRTPTTAATPTLVNPHAVNGTPNATFSTAAPVAAGADVPGVLTGAQAVDMYKVTVAADGTVLALLTAADAAQFQLSLIPPSRGQAVVGTQLGTASKQARAPVRGETGVWYVEVTAVQGKRAPVGPYTLRVETAGIGTPVPAPTP